MLKTLFSSAAKIVFILLAVTACVAFLFGKLEAKDFMTLASLAFAFYFVTPSPVVTTDPTGTSRAPEVK